METMKKEQLAKFFEKYAIYVILLAMIVVMSILRPESFLSVNNFTNIMRQMSVIGVMSLGVTFCIITAGTDLSGGSVVAVSSIVAAIFASTEDQGGVMILVAILAAILAGAIAGLLNGLVIAYGKVPPFIATLGMMSIARGIAMILSGGGPIGSFTEPFNEIGSGMIGGFLPYPVIIFAICSFLAYTLLHKSKFGTYVYAIGGNENAALVSGLSVNKVKTAVYVLAGIFYGVAAIVLTSRQQAGIPSVGIGYDMEAITCAIIGGSSFSGGIGTIGGNIVGAIRCYKWTPTGKPL